MGVKTLPPSLFDASNLDCSEPCMEREIANFNLLDTGAWFIRNFSNYKPPRHLHLHATIRSSATLIFGMQTHAPKFFEVIDGDCCLAWFFLPFFSFLTLAFSALGGSSNTKTNAFVEEHSEFSNLWCDTSNLTLAGNFNWLKSVHLFFYVW